MFATLDPTTRRLRLPRDQEVIINDTVGFIRDLPPDLLAAFRSTLEEIAGSSLLVHLVDVANPRWHQQIISVDRILAELKFDQIPRVLAFNKVDLVGQETLVAMKRQAKLEFGGDPIAISAANRESLRPLLDAIHAGISKPRLLRDSCAPSIASEFGR